VKTASICPECLKERTLVELYDQCCPEDLQVRLCQVCIDKMTDDQGDGFRTPCGEDFLATTDELMKGWP
jgi:hypothetical protein